MHILAGFHRSGHRISQINIKMRILYKNTVEWKYAWIALKWRDKSVIGINVFTRIEPIMYVSKS